MANKIIKKLTVLILVLLMFLTSQIKCFSHEQEFKDKDFYLKDLKSLMLTMDYANDFSKLEEELINKDPSILFIEEWLVAEMKDKNFLKKLRKLTKKHNTKLILATGKNIWFGKRGVENIFIAYEKYQEYVDGIVLRIEPSKSNVWKNDDESIQVQILNQMLDAYSAIYSDAQKRNKLFIAEFPFWLTEFQGPKGSFSNDACLYTDKIIFLIDDEEKLKDKKLKWNDITCPYLINIAERATRQNSGKVNEYYKTLKNDLTLYQNFNGYIIDTGEKISNITQTDESTPTDIR